MCVTRVVVQDAENDGLDLVGDDDLQADQAPVDERDERHLDARAAGGSEQGARGFLVAARPRRSRRVHDEEQRGVHEERDERQDARPREPPALGERRREGEHHGADRGHRQRDRRGRGGGPRGARSGRVVAVRVIEGRIIVVALGGAARRE